MDTCNGVFSLEKEEVGDIRCDMNESFSKMQQTLHREDRRWATLMAPGTRVHN